MVSSSHVSTSFHLCPGEQVKCSYAGLTCQPATPSTGRVKRGLKGYPWRASDHTHIGYRLARQSTVILDLELPTCRSVRVNRHNIYNIDSKTLEAFRVSRPSRFFRVARIRIFAINCWHKPYLLSLTWYLFDPTLFGFKYQPRAKLPLK